jgi:hypothetical protein
MDGEVGQSPREKVIGGIRPVVDREDRSRKLPGKAQAEGDQRQAEQNFQDFFPHYLSRKNGTFSVWPQKNAKNSKKKPKNIYFSFNSLCDPCVLSRLTDFDLSSYYK